MGCISFTHVYLTLSRVTPHLFPEASWQELLFYVGGGDRTIMGDGMGDQPASVR
jgi:hypothetical protein